MLHVTNNKYRICPFSLTAEPALEFTGLKGMNALIEAKESIEGSRKLNTLDNLLKELRVYVNTTQE